VKDFMREYGRPAAIFAAAAFVMSFFVGLLSRNPFGTVLLRALALAVVFGAIGIGIMFVVKKYLPELAGGVERQASKPVPESHSIDITLQEERPGGPGDGAGVEPEELAEAQGPEEAEEGQLLEEAGEAAEAVHGEPFAVGKPGTETDQEYELSERDAVVDAAPPGEQAAVETLEPAGPAAAKKAAGGGTPGLEALPDFGDLGTGGGSARVEGAARMERRRPTRPSDAARGDLGQESPESLAKAIRTVIKRDERG
jgi:hypothetical protein